MICPRDNISLQEKNLGEVVFHYCEKCLGMWFTKDNLRSILQGSKEQRYLPDIPEPGIKHDPDSDNTPCPVNQHGVMSHFDFEGVKLDLCRRHKGIWFDHDELIILYAAYLKETYGESFLKEDTRRFIFSLFMRKEPLLSKEKAPGFLVGMNLLLAPLDIIGWIITAHGIDEIKKDESRENE